MSTWTFRRSILCLCLGLTVAACQRDGARGGLFAPNPDRAFDNPRRNAALPEAALAGGAITLSPPRGFCVDARSLGPGFAVVARCDSLGSRRAPPEAPLGMILVSVAAPSEPPSDLNAALTALMPRDVDVLDTRVTEALALKQLRGTTPAGADPRHWRGLARIGPHLLGLTAYAPTGGELAGDAGGRVLDMLVRDTRTATAMPAADTADESAARELGAMLGRVFRQNPIRD